MKLKFGMVGGTGGFIGDVHRKAAAYDGLAEMVCGAFSRSHDKNVEYGRRFGIDCSRVYDDYEQMAVSEHGKIDFVVVVTNNTSHFQVCKAFIEQGTDVVCDKPVTAELSEAEELMRLAREKNVLFCVTYTYMGYPILHQARELVAAGEIGEIMSVVCEYPQKGKLAGLLDGSLLAPGGKCDPEVVGKMGTMPDIGTHIFYTTDFITGLRPVRLLSRFDYQPGEAPLETGASVMLEFEGGASGLYWMSQVALGHDNDLRIRVFGKKGAIDWRHAAPGELKVSRINEPVRIYTAGNSYNEHASLSLSRVPSGHPDGFTDAIANVYRMFYDNVAASREGVRPRWSFPSLEDGVMGVRYAEACYRSHKQGNTWVEL